ncbi:AAA family ATPase [Nonomuraea sp. NPDC050691]|uniref:ParA family protein n=1 Tax=Nonomuraea sp. NPDC050691 TaxID=3155661 RepID=UPI003406DFE8
MSETGGALPVVPAPARGRGRAAEPVTAVIHALRAGDEPEVGPYRLVELAGDAEFRRRFAQEVKAARKVGGFYTAQPDQVTYPTRIPGLYVVPSYTSLKQVELAPPPGVEQVIDWAINNTSEPFDVEITDCGPSLGLLSVAALVGAPNIVIPLKASGFDLNALTELNRTLAPTKQRLVSQLPGVLAHGGGGRVLVQRHPDRLRTGRRTRRW